MSDSLEKRRRGRPAKGALCYDRGAVIIAYSTGTKLEAIAALHGITRQRVEQIARSHGLSRRRSRMPDPVG